MFKKSHTAILIAGALFAAQAGATGSGLGQSDTSGLSDEFGSSQQLTVFNPDGSSYAITPIEMEVATFDRVPLIAADESAPGYLTVFEPTGLIYSYEFTPANEVAIWEPMDLYVIEEDTSVEPVVLSDEDVMSRPTYVVYYVSPPMYTGILEEATS